MNVIVTSSGPSRTMRTEILNSMARTLYVTAYADAIDNGAIEGPAAGSGEDWMDVAPDAPAEIHTEAHALAEKILAEFLELNGGTLETLLTEWCTPESQRYNRGRAHDTDLFGHYIAMQSLGHGVGLNDDTSPDCRDWKTGDFEGLWL